MVPSERSLDKWLAWMETLHPAEIDLGLERVASVAHAVGIDAPHAKVITVAGTNGKGSFVAALAALLSADGSTYGAYTSPHILRYNERISINGEDASDRAICEAFEAIERVRGDTSLTYFEFGTLAALYLFQQAGVDYYLLEVGLGGRLDAVNIIDPDLAVITSIGLDHEAWLGSDRESIAREKAGILRKNIPFICVDAEAPTALRTRANTLECDAYFLGERMHLREKNGLTCLQWLAGNGTLEELVLATAHLPKPSMLAAVQAYALMGHRLSREAADILQNVRLSGRMETFHYADCEWVLDVAHNPDATKLLVSELSQRGVKKIVLVAAFMQDKKLSKIVEIIAPLISQCVCTEVPGFARSYSAASVSDVFSRAGVVTHVETSPSGAIKKARELWRSDVCDSPILVMGSFYLISEVKKYFGHAL